MVEEKIDKEETTHSMDISAIDIYPLIGLLISIFNSKAWQYMGLRINPDTQKIERDLSKARVAIDCIAFLSEKLETQLNEDEKNRLRISLTDLQVNFVRQQNASTESKWI